jgi:hypothetical protein
MKRNRKDHGFMSLRVEGGILPPEFLQTISSLKTLKQTGPDYSISTNLNIKEEIGRYWRIAQGLWEDYKDRLNQENISQSDACIKYWLCGILVQVLGFRDVNAISPIPLGDRVFPINYKTANGAVPLVLTTKDFDLDNSHQKFGDEGRRRPPHELLQEYLNAEDACLWGMVSNGTKIRLLRDNPSLTRPAYIEADLEQMFEEDLYSDFAVFWLTFHSSRLTPKDDKPTSCILEAWRSKAQEIGERALKNLRLGVTEALRQLGDGFLQHPANQTLRSDLQEGSLAPLDYFQELLRLVYRFLFLLTAEERNLLFHPGATDEHKHLYENGYSIFRLREKALKKRNYDQHSDLWQGLQVTFTSLARGAEPLGLTALGGLFANDQCPNLDKGKIDNARLLEAVRSLSFFRSGNTLARINYRDMDTEELGSVYESLLELHPKVDVSPWQFGFLGDEGGDNIQGSARKLTGSYYTPSSLVNELIKSALEPVMKQTVKNHPEDPIGALLKLRIMDPACGSGHFLLAAARRMANEIARLEAMPDTPNEKQRQHALREVVQHSIYGVDRNPLSIELCKTALWIETMEPGKPLTFLDPHIRFGDSLVGILDPKIMEDGIPDDAYKALSGDDKTVSRELKRRNKQFGKNIHGNLFEPESLQEMTIAAVDLDAMLEDTVEQIEEKRKAWETAHEDTARRQEEFRANLFVGAFFTPKTPENIDCVPITEDLNRINKGMESRRCLEKAVAGLAEKHRFFHWHIEFSEVFEKGGFDVVLGNPPWERIKIQEKEFFASRSPEIANAPNAAKRRELIDALNRSEASLAEKMLAREFEDAKHESEGASQFVRASKRFPLTGVGDVNTYGLFAELFLDLQAKTGMAGIILPTGILSDDTSKVFFQELINSERLISAKSFENEEFIFSGLPNVIRFSLLTLSGINNSGPQTSFVFYIRRIEQLSETERFFELDPDDFKQISPNTQTCPVFRSKKDVELTKIFYKRFPILMDEGKGQDGNPWGIRFMRMFDMANDSNLFKTFDQLEKTRAKFHGVNWVDTSGEIFVPLYEGKFIWHFDHRFGSYDQVGKEKGRGGRGLPLTSLKRYSDPNFSVTPRYWISEKFVNDRLRNINWTFKWILGWRDVTSSKLERTVNATIFSRCGVGDTLLLMFPIGHSAKHISCLLANLDSLSLDFIARQKIGGTHLKYYTLKQLPILSFKEYLSNDISFIKERVLQLTYTANDLKPFAEDLGYDGPPFKWDPERRAILRAELDAYYSYLYGLTRDELRYILDPADVYGEDYPSETFRVLKNNEISEFGEYRTQRLVLEAWDRFSQDGTFDLTKLNDPSTMPRLQVELTDKKKELEELHAQVKSSPLPKLFVEGETDKMIIKAAWSVFNPDTPMPFTILSASGTMKLGSLAAKGSSLKLVLGDQLLCILVDNDLEGRKLCNDGHLKPGGRWKEQSNGTHWCLLEPTEEFKAFAGRYQIPPDYWPFTIEACFAPTLRRQALKNGAYGFSKNIQNELMGNQEFQKKISISYKEQNESHDDYFYFMATDHETKEKFAEWITHPDRCTLKNYQPFEKIIKGLSTVIKNCKKDDHSIS